MKVAFQYTRCNKKINMKHEISYFERRNFYGRNFREAKNLRNFWNKLLQMTPYKTFCDNEFSQMGNFSNRINTYPIQTIYLHSTAVLTMITNLYQNFFYVKNPNFLWELTFANSL